MRRWLNSFRFARIGITRLFREERNARIEGILALVAVALGLITRISPTEWAVVILCIGAVLSAEAFNAAIERLADMHGREPDPRIGALKDLAAGAVLILSIASLAVGIVIFLPRLLVG